MIWAIVGVLSIVLLLLRIGGMLGGGRPLTAAAMSDPAPGVRSAEEVRAISETMPSEWLTYVGMTPPLRLKIRGQSEDNYTRITRQLIAPFGPGGMNHLSPAQLEAFTTRVVVEAYVSDWEGAEYPNEARCPFRART